MLYGYLYLCKWHILEIFCEWCYFAICLQIEKFQQSTLVVIITMKENIKRGDPTMVGTCTGSQLAWKKNGKIGYKGLEGLL